MPAVGEAAGGRGSLTLDDLRGYARIATDPLAAAAQRAGLTPNQLSALSLTFAVMASGFYYISSENGRMLIPAALLVILNAVSDATDGALARRTGTAEPRGDFLDHVIDRYSDVFILGGIIFAKYAPWEVGLLAVIGVLLTSYIGTQAQALNLGRYYGGVMGRADRLVVILIATLANAVYAENIAGLSILGWALALIMFTSHLTALQRFNHVWRKL